MSETATLLKLPLALGVVRETDPGMHVQILLAMLVIARRPGCSPGDLITELDTTSASVARIIARLSTWETKSTKGYGLVEVEMDMDDRRRRLLWPTKQGQKFVKRIEEVLK